MKKFFSTLWGCIYPVLIYFLVTIIVSIIFMFITALTMNLSGSVESDLMEYFSGNALLLTAIVDFAVAPILLLILYLYRRKPDKNRYMYSYHVTVISYIITAAGAVGLCLAANNLISLSGIAQYDKTFSDVSDSIENSSMMLQVIATVIAAPLAEDLLFRGVIFSNLRRSYGSAAAIIWSSVLFGVFHGNITQGLYAFILGLILAYCVDRTGTVKTGIWMHAFANLFSLILSESPVGDFLYSGLLIFILSTGAGIAICIYMVRVIRKCRLKIPVQNQPPFGNMDYQQNNQFPNNGYPPNNQFPNNGYPPNNQFPNNGYPQNNQFPNNVYPQNNQGLLYPRYDRPWVNNPNGMNQQVLYPPNQSVYTNPLYRKTEVNPQSEVNHPGYTNALYRNDNVNPRNVQFAPGAPYYTNALYRTKGPYPQDIIHSNNMQNTGNMNLHIQNMNKNEVSYERDEASYHCSPLL